MDQIVVHHAFRRTKYAPSSALLQAAKAAIARDRPDLDRIDIIPYDSFVTLDYREDRVRVRRDDAGKVTGTPMCG